MDATKTRRVAEALGWSVFPSKLAQDDVCITIDGVGHVWVHDAVIDRVAALLDERDEAIALATAPMLARHQPCGCIVCQCESNERCNGCGSKRCGLSECVFADPLLRDAVYEDAPTYMQLRAELAAAKAWAQNVAKPWKAVVDDLKAENERLRNIVGDSYRIEEAQP